MEKLRLSAVDLAARIRSRELSPVEVLEAHIRRIEEVNPHINALVVENFEQARREATALEAKLCRSEPEDLPPFFGVPFTVKELIGAEGLPITAGVVARKHRVAERDATVVRRLRESGAVLLGLTNVAEAGLWVESANRVYGRTRNPHDTARIAGGSSGGEAAIIAAGGSPMGIGADTGGSIRNPAFFNGICGHKPTGGLLPIEGHWPPAGPERARYCVAGPMARRVEDLSAMMGVMSPNWAGSERMAGAKSARTWPPPPPPSEVKVYYFSGTGLGRAHPAVLDSLHRALHALADRGYRVEHWRPKSLLRTAEMWSSLVSGSGPESVRELLGDGRPIPLAKEWAKSLVGRSNHPFYSLFLATFEGFANTSDRYTKALAGARDALRDEIDAKLSPRGVLISPPYPRPAPRHHVPLLSPLSFIESGFVNVLEFPATAVPTGVSADGLPVGVQIIGRRFDDALTLSVAADIQHSLGTVFEPAG